MNFIQFVKFLLENPKRERVWNLLKQRYWYDATYSLRKLTWKRIYKKSIPYWKRACDGDLDVKVARSKGWDL